LKHTLIRRIIIPALACLLALISPARADTSVVFNEIMYHPATNEPAMEWLELYNQMAVDVRLKAIIAEWCRSYGGLHRRFFGLE